MPTGSATGSIVRGRGCLESLFHPELVCFGNLCPVAFRILLIALLLLPAFLRKGQIGDPSFQKLVDAAAPGAVLSPPAGTYADRL